MAIIALAAYLHVAYDTTAKTHIPHKTIPWLICCIIKLIMKKVTLRQVQESIADIANRDKYTEDILYELLAAYGRSPNAITQLRQGQTNRAEAGGEVLQKDVVYFKTVPTGTSLEHTVEEQFENPLTQRFNPRYIIATDLASFAAKDTLKNTTLSINWADIDNDLDFFYGWTGDEVVDSKTEAVADRRAADKMNLLYAEIEKLNREKLADPASNFRHELNVFFTRLLFCFFAEDTGLFNDKQFTHAIKLTQQDGSDLHDFFEQLFIALDSEDRSSMSAPYSGFPHVNGSLFNASKHSIAIPDFNAQARHLILECTSLNWGEINPDIFGTMFQGVVDPDHRDENGMDYTSVPNIMKVIEPLFLDDLRERFGAVYNTPSSLRELLDRIRNIKVFDPACGSGNFLIISYKKLRELEGSILARLEELKREQRKKPSAEHTSLFSAEDLSDMQKDAADTPLASGIDLSNFYGIEIDDFAHELAILSLYLAKHQMDSEFEKKFPVKLKHLPLIENKNIVKANAARIEWGDVLHNNSTDEIYLIGNPPYKGGKKQTQDQKNDLKHLFGTMPYSRNLDYISLWFIKGARYIKGSAAKLAFVSTNSIVQGEHIANLWPFIYEQESDVFFAYTSFKWTNNATSAAAVTCVIVGMQWESSTKATRSKKIFTEGLAVTAYNINAYLADADNIIVNARTSTLSNLPQMVYGNMPLEGNFLKLTPEEMHEIIDENPESKKYIRPMIGGKILVDGGRRYCLWIEDEDLEDALQNPKIKNRVDGSREFRLNGGDVAKTLANKAHQFRYRKTAEASMIITPCTTTGNRDYVPSALFSNEYITDNSVQVLYDAPLYIFAILSSRAHMVWMKSVAGRLQDNYRYSAQLVYNTFPLPMLTQIEMDALAAAARKILLTRENYSAKTLSQLYNPEKMPTDLLEAHEENDRLVDGLYKKGGFTGDEDRLAALFDLYKQMIAKA